MTSKRRPLLASHKWKKVSKPVAKSPSKPKPKPRVDTYPRMMPDPTHQRLPRLRPLPPSRNSLKSSIAHLLKYDYLHSGPIERWEEQELARLTHLNVAELRRLKYSPTKFRTLIAAAQVFRAITPAEDWDLIDWRS
jgi:hypothetical protein